MGVVAVSQKEGALTHVLAHDLQIACCSRIRSPCRNSARGLSGAWGDEVSGSFVPLGMDMTPCNPSRPAECAGAPGVIQAQMQGAQADALLAMPPAARQARDSPSPLELPA